MPKVSNQWSANLKTYGPLAQKVAGQITLKKLALLCTTMLVGVGILWCTAYQLPPSLLPPASYNLSPSVLQAEKVLTLLVPKYQNDVKEYLATAQNKNLVYQDLDRKYIVIFDSIVSTAMSPEDLANLAIWAEHDGIQPDSNIYRIVFYRSISRLGEMKGLRSRYALWKVRQSVVLNGDFDGRPGEALLEAQQQ